MDFGASGVGWRVVQSLNVYLLEIRTLEIETKHRRIALTVEALDVGCRTDVVAVLEFYAVVAEPVC